jgi:uncharacterized protein YdiU (UPF0061 family)
VAGRLGLDVDWLRQSEQLPCLSGARLWPGSKPFAMHYHGRQFGQYNPELGDGRALLMGEVTGQDGLYELHLKGAGRTPYSRFGDGRAVLRSSVREYLASAAMEGLGIPTTLALYLVMDEQEKAMREVPEPVAMLMRVARTHVRFGHFEYLFHTAQREAFDRLLDLMIARFLPAYQCKPDRAAALFELVVHSTARTIGMWQAYGFCHGVMNTDNMSMIGDTFDYGPYAFLDDYDPGHICNRTDVQGRYAFNRQPGIGLWNLNCLAVAFSDHVARADLVDMLAQFELILVDTYQERMARRLGLEAFVEGDDRHIEGLLGIMAEQRLDYHQIFRGLAEVGLPDPAAWLSLFDDPVPARAWLEGYRQRLCQGGVDERTRQQRMQACNPKYVLRNHLAQRVIEAVHQGDTGPMEVLLELLAAPFRAQPGKDDWARPPASEEKTGPLSCSS